MSITIAYSIYKKNFTDKYKNTKTQHLRPVSFCDLGAFSTFLDPHL